LRSNHECDDTIAVHFGRCGKPLVIALTDLGDARTIDCDTCATKAPLSSSSVYVAGEDPLSIHVTDRSG
jgi:hypothetical protein